MANNSLLYADVDAFFILSSFTASLGLYICGTLASTA
jgi:hypothetical protein